MRPDCLGVLGLGAIGGSVAWQASRAGVRRVLGYSPRPRESVAALRAGAISEAATSPAFVVRHADLVVIAAPPAATLRLITTLATPLKARGTWCTDVTSVKAPVADVARRVALHERFAGSHPFAGTHRAGFEAATAERFRGATVYVTPIDEHHAAAREIAHFWEHVLEAAPVIVAAARHDALLAWTSHLPQAVSSALGRAFAASGPRGATYGAGARDTTRLAASGVDMWRDVLLLNREEVLGALDRYEEALGELRRALLDGSPEAVTTWLRSAARWRRGRES